MVFSLKKEKKCHLTFSLQAIPLLSPPAEVDHATIDAKNVNRYEGKGFLGGLTDLGGAGGGAGGGGAGGMNISTLTSENIYNQYNHSRGQVEVDYRVGGMTMGQEHFYSKNQFGLFDGMALPYEFLGEYYFKVSRSIVNENTKHDISLRDAKKRIWVACFHIQ